MLRPFIRHGTIETTQEELRYGSNLTFRYQLDDIAQSAFKLPISDSRILHSAVDISYALAVKELYSYLALINSSEWLAHEQQKELIILSKFMVLKTLESGEIREDKDKVKKYIQKLNTVTFGIKNEPVKTEEFTQELIALLRTWMLSIMIEEKLIFPYHHFELAEEDFKHAGYQYFVRTHNEEIVPGGICYDFAFTQLCEEEAYTSIFGCGTRDFYTSEMSIQWLSNWGYRQIFNPAEFRDFDLIIYGSNLLRDEYSVIKHYGLLFDGKVISKLGVYPDLYKHDIQSVCLAYGNHYYVFRKSAIPSLDEMMRVQREKLEKLTPLTAKGIKEGFTSGFWQAWMAKLDNVLPCSDIVPAGRSFLVRYAGHATKLFQEVPDYHNSNEADLVGKTRNDCLDELTNLCAKLKI